LVLLGNARFFWLAYANLINDRILDPRSEAVKEGTNCIELTVGLAPPALDGATRI
jgi:hypothetical protein